MLTEAGSCPYDGCSSASSVTKTTSVAVSVCKMNQVTEVQRLYADVVRCEQEWQF